MLTLIGVTILRMLVALQLQKNYSLQLKDNSTLDYD